MTIPIFIITYNRLEPLLIAFNALLTLKGDYKIIFCDNHSTYTPLITWLKEREKENYLVYWNKTSELYVEIQNTVTKWYNTNDSPHFVIMDPDVEIQCPEDTLDLLTHLLDTHKKKNRVGLLMRWDDIPDSYPLKSRVCAKQKRLYGTKKPENIKWKEQDIKFVMSDIDTTFTMFRKGYTNFKNVHNAIVTLEPYHAKHLDWYIDINNMTEEQIAYCLRRNRYTHWCGQHLYSDVSKIHKK